MHMKSFVKEYPIPINSFLASDAECRHQISPYDVNNYADADVV